MMMTQNGRGKIFHNNLIYRVFRLTENDRISHEGLKLSENNLYKSCLIQ